MPHSDCEPIEHLIDLLTQQIDNCDNQIAALQNEVIGTLDLLWYLNTQRSVDQLLKNMRMLRIEWNMRMNELADCKSKYSAYDYR